MTPSREILLQVTSDLSEVTRNVDMHRTILKGGHGAEAEQTSRKVLPIYLKYHHSLMMIADMIGLDTYAYKR